MGRGSRDVRLEAKGRGKNVAAEPYVGEVDQAAHIHQQQHVMRGPIGLPGEVFHKTRAARLVTENPKASSP